MSRNTPILIVGTRPELIKVAPIYKVFQTNRVKPHLVLTNQQTALVSDLLPWFEIDSFTSLPELESNSLIGKFSEIVTNLGAFLECQPKDSWIFAQGDTTTVIASALAAFYTERPFAHVEAGLRCETPWLPFPEEGNRRIVSQVAKLNFAPTSTAVENLIKDGIDRKSIFQVGNSGIDSLLISIRKIKELQTASLFRSNSNVKKILITVHRRESFGEPMMEICNSIKWIASQYPVEILWPVHPNPSVQTLVRKEMSKLDNVFLLNPLSYQDLISAMSDCDFVMTDSGGIQEEAPALGKPVIVLRNESERMELMNAGGGALVGSNSSKIRETARQLLEDEDIYNSMVLSESPFGRGNAADQIWEIFKSQ